MGVLANNTVLSGCRSANRFGLDLDVSFNFCDGKAPMCRAGLKGRLRRLSKRVSGTGLRESSSASDKLMLNAKLTKANVELIFNRTRASIHGKTISHGGVGGLHPDFDRAGRLRGFLFHGGSDSPVVTSRHMAAAYVGGNRCRSGGRVHLCSAGHSISTKRGTANRFPSELRYDEVPGVAGTPPAERTASFTASSTLAQFPNW